jgi:hypothetical protein
MDYHGLLKELLHINKKCEAGENASAVVTAHLLGCGAGLT